jgi:RNA polymerase sigma factor (sigma-70 family)
MLATRAPDSRLQSAHRRDDADPGAAVEELVAGARRGERWAWDALIQRFRPLVRAAAASYRLSRSDVEDVDQTVWLRLVENLERIREPRTLPKWLLTTANHESLRMIRTRRRTMLVDPLDDPAKPAAAEPTAGPATQLLRQELSDAVRRGLDELPVIQRELLTLLVGERPLSYREVSEMMAMPVGSIGPTRARGLARLRATPAIRDYLSS